MKNFLADGRLTPLSSHRPPLHPLAHPLTTPIPHPRPGMGNGGGRRVHQGNTIPANITTVVEMQYWRNLFTLNILAANALTQIIPYSSSLSIVFHSVIFNSVVSTNEKSGCKQMIQQAP